MTVRRTKDSHPPQPDLDIGGPLDAEQLVLLGFRCCMAGHELGCVECVETGWYGYAGTLGVDTGRRAFTSMQNWIKALRASSCRSIASLPYNDPQICRDEAVALSLISALQGKQRNLARIAAHHLTGATSISVIDNVTAAAGELAAELYDAGWVLHPVTPEAIDAIASVYAPATNVIPLKH